MFSSGVYPSFGNFSAPSASSLLNHKTEISFDTSSREPTAVRCVLDSIRNLFAYLRSRVFVGNLNTSRITRDDVIQMFQAYGALAGVTLFKGYAFVQYSNASDADLAVSALHGYNWNNSILDVKLAAHGMKHTTSPATGSSTLKRGADAFSIPKAKKTATEHEIENNYNKTFATTVSTPVPGIEEHASIPVDAVDTLICGECRFVTAKIDDFIQHRKQPCQIAKAEGEPTKLQCFTCTDQFPTSWQLVKHLTTVHKMILYKEDVSMADASSNANNGKNFKSERSDANESNNSGNDEINNSITS